MKPGVTADNETFNLYTTPAYVPSHKSRISKKTLAEKHNSQLIPTKPNSNLSSSQSTAEKSKSTPPSTSFNPWSKPSKQQSVAREEDVDSKFVILKKKK